MLFSLFITSALGTLTFDQTSSKRATKCATLLSDEAYTTSLEALAACDKANDVVHGEGPGTCKAVQMKRGGGFKLCRGEEATAGSGSMFIKTKLEQYKLNEVDTCEYNEGMGKMNCFDCLAKGPVCSWLPTDAQQRYAIETCGESGYYDSRRRIDQSKFYAKECPKSHCESAEIVSKCSQCGICEEANCAAYLGYTNEWPTQTRPPICTYPICEFICGTDNVCDICSNGARSINARSVESRTSKIESLLSRLESALLSDMDF